MSTQLLHRIHIDAGIDKLFAYVSTPEFWPDWHPSSLRVYGVAGRPLHTDEGFDEDIRAAGREARLRWRVVACDAPTLWSAQAAADNGVDLMLAYRLQPEASGVLFERRVNYRLRGWWLNLLDPLILRRRINAESELSLRQLKQVMERPQRSAATAGDAAMKSPHETSE